MVKSSTFTLTFGEFVRIWKTSLLTKLMKEINDALGRVGVKGRVWFSVYPPKQDEYGNFVFFRLRAWCAPPSKRESSPVSVLPFIKVSIAVLPEGVDRRVVFVQAFVSPASAVCGKLGRVYQLHGPDEDVVKIVSEEIEQMQSAQDFENLFLEKVRPRVVAAAIGVVTAARDYPHNWIISLFRYFEKYGGAKLGENVYVKVVPLQIYEERELPSEKRLLKLVAVVRAPYFSFAIPFEYYRSPATKLGENMPLDFKVISKLCVDTPFIEPTLIYITNRWLSLGVANTIQVQAAEERVNLGLPLSVVSDAMARLTPIIASYLNEAKEASASLGMPTGRGQAMFVCSILFAFFGVASALLKRFGFDFVVLPGDEFYVRYYSPPEEVKFEVNVSYSFTFKCREAFSGKVRMLRLIEILDFSVDGSQWNVRTPLWVVFGLVGSSEPESAALSLSEDETKAVMSDRGKVREKLLDFARQVHQHLETLTGKSR